MTDTDMVSALVGFVLPLAASLVLQQNWHSYVKGIVTLVLCLLAGLAITFFDGRLADATELPRAFLIVFFAAMGAYHTFWKPSTIAPKIEHVTSLDQSKTRKRRKTDH